MGSSRMLNWLTSALHTTLVGSSYSAQARTTTSRQTSEWRYMPEECGLAFGRQHLSQDQLRQLSTLMVQTSTSRKRKHPMTGLRLLNNRCLYLRPSLRRYGDRMRFLRRLSRVMGGTASPSATWGRTPTPLHREWTTNAVSSAGRALNPYLVSIRERQLTTTHSGSTGRDTVSGVQNTSSPSQAIRKDAGKIRFDLVPAEWIEGLALICDMGAKKYAPNQWREKPMEHWRVEASLLRHINAYRLGEKCDSESGLPHLLHASWNALALYYYEEKGL